MMSREGRCSWSSLSSRRTRLKVSKLRMLFPRFGSRGMLDAWRTDHLGGTRILLGGTFVGEILDCPLPVEGAWQMVGVQDIGLGQSAYLMTNGRFWIEGMPAGAGVNIPVASISDVIRRVGPHDLDLAGSKEKADGLPQGPFECIFGLPQGAAYPCLWNHNTRLERRLIVEPDSHCRVREVGGVTPQAFNCKGEGTVGDCGTHALQSGPTV